MLPSHGGASCSRPLLLHTGDLKPSRRSWWHCGHQLHGAVFSPGSAVPLSPSLSFSSVGFSTKHSFKVKIVSKKSGRMTRDFFSTPHRWGLLYNPPESSYSCRRASSLATGDFLYALYHPIFPPELFALNKKLQHVYCARVCLTHQLQLTVHHRVFGKTVGAKVHCKWKRIKPSLTLELLYLPPQAHLFHLPPLFSNIV